MLKKDAFHILLLNVLFVSILVISYLSIDNVSLSPALGGVFYIEPLFWLFAFGLILALIIFFIVFYILTHSHD